MPAPDDVDGILRWSLGPERKPTAFLARVAELRLKRQRGAAARGADSDPADRPDSDTPAAPPVPGYADPDWLAFQAAHATPSLKDAAAQIQDLEQHLAFADFALRRARARGDEHNQKKYADEVIKFSRAIKDQKLLVERLGIDSGELIKREAVERLLAAHAYWTMRSTDAALDSLSRRLVDLSFPEEARAILEPELLSTRFITAYARAVPLDTPSALPEWLVARLREVVDDFIESGRAHFSAALGEHQDGSGI